MFPVPYPLEDKPTFVDRDAYNYIINGTHTTAYFVFAVLFMIFTSMAFDFIIQSQLVADYMLDYYSGGNIRDRNNANAAIRELVKVFYILKEMMINYNIGS
ncbi:hypothetical protein [Solibacillus sp. FSL W8-0372]|uniref:hypothetical protein n=1 Tax=Solibacillus sp. FSL W8-0372 TaxID=2921713 RepID=UPI0030D492AD